VIGLVLPLPVLLELPATHATVKLVAVPPLAFWVNVMVVLTSPAAALTIVGAPGTVTAPKASSAGTDIARKPTA
jgi:hypothetical protein